jgi:membrane fusion protein, multidrug efflux system
MPNDFTIPPSKKRRWGKPIVIVLLIASVLGGLVAWRASNAKKVEPKKDDVKVFEFAQRDIATVALRDLGNVIPLSGTLTPLTQAMVKSKVAAEVSKVHVQEGERVSAGQVLVSLDTQDLRARLDSQQATVAEMKARLELAAKNEANNRQLVAKNFISQNALDAVTSNAAVARANLVAAESQAAISQRALNDAAIRAPFSGVIAKRMVNIGEKISPDMQVMQVVDLTKMELEAMVPVADIPNVKIGQAISFTVDGFQARQFTGKIERINPSAEAGSRSIAIFVSIPNPEQSLKGGMFASGKLAALSSAPIKAIPLVAVREEGGQSFVFIINKDKIERKPVTVGLRNIDLGLAEIREGLAEGTEVVAVKMDGLKAGATAIYKSTKSVAAPAAVVDAKK